MKTTKFFVFTILLALFMAGCASKASIQAQEVQALEVNDPQADCPLITSKEAFEPPDSYSPSGPFPNEFWFGSEHLWTALPENGTWSGLPKNPSGYTQKIFWWSSLFSLKDEPEPALVVFGERLDAKAPLLKVSRATNAFAADIGEAMLVGVDFPTEGCWKVTGQYKKTGLSFTIWIEP